MMIGVLLMTMAYLLPADKYYVKFWGAALMLLIALYLSFNVRPIIVAAPAYIAAFSALLGNVPHQSDGSRKYFIQHRFAKAVPYGVAIITLLGFFLLTFRF